MSQSVAKRLFPDGHVIGSHIQFGTEPETRDVEVVGIVGDTRLEDPHLRGKGFVLLNLWQLPRMARWGNLQVEFSGSVSAMESILRKQIDRTGLQQVFLMSTLAQLREQSLVQDRLLVAIGKVYVGLTVTLAAVGLAGLLLYLVASRQKEFSIRIALGADLRDLNALVLREAIRLTGTGLLIGTPLAYFAVRSLSALVYGAPGMPTYPVLIASAVLSAVAILSALAPMRKASLINPNDALRAE